uniref:Uncharacterized protein n=1 Tax=Arundo donax TaxID=35708 RepID=A0A0A9CYD1_ARUDO
MACRVGPTRRLRCRASEGMWACQKATLAAVFMRLHLVRPIHVVRLGGLQQLPYHPSCCCPHQRVHNPFVRVRGYKATGAG